MIRYNIPIGISEFEKIRKNDYYYVDKTELIQALVKTEPVRLHFLQDLADLERRLS